MKCSRCSAEIPAQSRFCLRCGTAVPTTTTTSQMPSGFQSVTPAAPFTTAPSGNKKLFATIGILVVAVLALGAFVVKGLVQKSGSGDKGQLVQAPGAGGSGTLVQAPGDSKPAPMVQAPGDGKAAPIVQQPDAPLPTDVMDYLAHLRKVEASKRQLIREGRASLTAMKDVLPADQIKGFMDFENSDKSGHGDTADPKNAISGTANKAMEIDKQWNDLNIFFRSKNPPASCAVLAQKYGDHLDKTQSLCVKAFGILDDAMKNPRDAYAKILSMQGEDKAIDASMNSADRELEEVCRQFRLRKDFDIGDEKSGGGGGGLFGL